MKVAMYKASIPTSSMSASDNSFKPYSLRINPRFSDSVFVSVPFFFWAEIVNQLIKSFSENQNEFMVVFRMISYQDYLNIIQDYLNKCGSFTTACFPIFETI